MTRLLDLSSLLCLYLLSGCGQAPQGSGCGQAPEGPFANLGLAPEIHGQIKDWNLGEGYTVVGYVSGADTPPPYRVFKTAPISRDGRFTVPLLDEVALAPYLDEWHLISRNACGSICPSDTRGALAFFEVKQDDVTIGRLAYSVPSKGSAQMDIGFQYVDRSAAWTGHCEYQGDRYTSGSKDTVDISYQAGWNVMIRTTTHDMYGINVSNTHSAFAPASAEWFFAPLSRM